MKSTAASLTLILLATLTVSGCHQTAQRAARIANSQPSPSKQFEDYESRLSAAELDENKGNTKAAKKAYESLAKENPTNPLVYHRLGIIAAGSGDFDTANRNFRRAFVLSSDDPELLADWGYSLFLQGEYEDAEALTQQSALLSPNDSRIANNLQMIYSNSPLSPSTGPPSVPMMSNNREEIVVAEAIDSSIPDAQAELQRAGYEKDLHPFEEISLPAPTSELVENEFAEPLEFLEPLEYTAELSPSDASPVVFESEFAAIDEPANDSGLSQPVPDQPASGNAHSVKTAGDEERFYLPEDITRPEPATEFGEPLEFLEPLEHTAELMPSDASPVILESEFATIDEPANESGLSQPVTDEPASGNAHADITADGEELLHPSEETALPEPASEIVVAVSPEPLKLLTPLEYSSELTLSDAVPVLLESEFSTTGDPANESDLSQPVPDEPTSADTDSSITAVDEERFHSSEEITLPEPASEIVDAVLPDPLKFLEPLEYTTELTPSDAAPVLSESEFATIDEPANVSDLNQPVPNELASDEEEEVSIAPRHIRKLLTRARLELAAGDVEMSHAFAEAAAEISIPLQVYLERPEKVLDEIEFVTGHNSVMSLENPGIETGDFVQVVPPAPATYEESETDNVSATQAWDEAAANDPQGFRAIGRKSLSIAPKLVDSDGERRLLPERRAFRKLSQAPVVKHTVGYSRDWIPMAYSWEAPPLKYNPLYFEDPQLERYGNEVCILQPFLSGARFYATIPTLPYQMMSEGNSVCHEVYDFGYERPGDCVPYSLEVPEFSWTGALASGGWAYALVVILP